MSTTRFALAPPLIVTAILTVVAYRHSHQGWVTAGCCLVGIIVGVILVIRPRLLPSLRQTQITLGLATIATVAAGPTVTMIGIVIFAIVVGFLMSPGKGFIEMTMRHPDTPNSMRLIGFCTSLVTLLLGVSEAMVYHTDTTMTRFARDTLSTECCIMFMIAFDAVRRATRRDRADHR